MLAGRDSWWLYSTTMLCLQARLLFRFLRSGTSRGVRSKYPPLSRISRLGLLNRNIQAPARIISKPFFWARARFSSILLGPQKACRRIYISQNILATGCPWIPRQYAKVDASAGYHIGFFYARKPLWKIRQNHSVAIARGSSSTVIVKPSETQDIVTQLIYLTCVPY